MNVVLFVREDLLKATHKELKWIQAYTDKYGRVHATHQKHVLVADDHDDMKVSTGHGSFYQKIAHKNAIADIPNFQSLDIDHQANIILHHATELQAAASASAAVSGFKASMLAGKVPTPAQYQAMLDADSKTQGNLADAIAAKIGVDAYENLITQASAKLSKKSVTKKGNPDEPQAAQTLETSSQGQAQGAATADLAKPAEAANPGPTAQAKVTDELPPKIKAKLNDWATDGYVDRLKDAASDHGSSEAYAAYAKKLLEQFDPPESDGPWQTLKDWPGTKYKLNADGKWEAHGNGTSLGHVAIEGPELSAALFIKQGTPVPADVVAKLSDKSKAAIVKDAAAEFGMSPMDVQALLTANEKPIAPSVNPTVAVVTRPLSSDQLMAVQSIPWFKLKLSESNTNAKSHNAAISKIEAMAHAGDVAGLQAFVDAKAGAKQTYAKKQAQIAHQVLATLKSPNHQDSQPTQAATSDTVTQLTPAEIKGLHGWISAGKPTINKPGSWSVLWSKLSPGMKMAVKTEMNAATMIGLSSAQAKIKADGVAKMKSVVDSMSLAELEAIKDISILPSVSKAYIVQKIAELKDEAKASVASQTPLAGKPAYDHLAHAESDGGVHKVMIEVKSWLAANPGKEKELNQAVVDLGYSSLKVPVSGATLVNEEKKKLSPALQDFVMMFKFHGGPVANGMSIDQMMEGPDIAAFEAATPDEKSTVAAAISYYGPDKLNLFMQWVSDQNAKKHAAAQSALVPVTSNVYVNKTPGHNKFWSVSVHGNQMKTTYGKLGSMGSTTTKDFASPAAAVAAANKLKGEKVANGYEYGYTGVHQYDAPVDHNLASTPAVSTSSYAAPPESAPKDGDTKQGSDGTLVFKNGRWHKQGVVIPDFTKLTDGKWGGLYNDVAAALKNAVDTGGFDALKKHITYHKDGRISVFAANVKLKKLSSVEPQYMAEKKKRREAMHKLVMDLTAAAKKLPKGKKVVFTTGSPTATPTQPTAAAKPAPAAPTTNAKVSAPKVKIVAGKPPVTIIDGWQQTGPQKGSNPGGKFKDKNGQEWYCKFPADVDVAMNEFLAVKFYEMLGVAVPKLKLVEQGGKIGIASKWVDGITKGTSEQLAKAPGAHQAFALDAWLANWDVVGLSNDNLMLGKDGAAVRVDVGGSLVYRAQGGTKGADFGDSVPELETLLDASKNGKSAAVFGKIKKGDMAWGLTQLNKMKPSQIEELCQKAGPGSDADKAALAKKLIARRAYILEKMGVRDQWAHVKELDPSNLPVNPKDLPKPIDFANLHGPGKGLSSKAHVNAQNTLDSANMIAFAAKGNLTALKNYQYDAVDKDTGKPLGKKSIIDHPSSQIKNQWAGLIETLQSISTPPLDTLKMPSLGAAGSVAEISDLAGTFAPTDRVETVSAEHRMGFFMAVNQIDDVHSLVSRYKWSYLTSTSKFVEDAKAGFKKLSSAVRAYISAVQASGWINHVWSQGKPTVDASGNSGSYSGGVQTLSAKIYDDALEIPEGTTLTRGMYDTTAGKSMTKQLLNATPGLVIQNTDSMCASYKEGWGWGGDVVLTIRCGEGCKGTPSFASGHFGSEHEITTLPGQRFVVLSSEQKGKTVHVELLMLPPHDGYVVELGKLETLGKAIVVFFKRMM